MSTEVVEPTESTPDPDDWRGRAEESEPDEVSRGDGLRLQRRARRLIGELVAPHRRIVLVAAVLVVAENAVGLTGPLLIAAAIDRGVPAALAGRPGPLAWAVGGYAAAGLAGAGCARRSCWWPGGSGRTCCSTCAGGCSGTPSGCRSVSTRATRPAG